MCRLGLLAVALMLAGCGQTSSEGSSRIQFGSPAIRPDGEIASSYRCGAGTIWLPLKWSAVPADTAELVLYFGRFKMETAAGMPSVKVTNATLITDIDPSVRSIPTNTLPEGVVSSYYRPPNSCPPERKGQNVVLQLFALDDAQQLTREGIASASLDSESAIELTEEALAPGESEPSSDLAATLTNEALAIGRFTATYGPSTH